ncbi:MAG: GspE/PulE family protein [bacterium]
MPSLNPSIEDLLKSKTPTVASEETAEKLSEKMAEILTTDKERETSAKAQNLGLPYINLQGFPISPETLTLLEKEQADKLKTVCFFYNGQEIRLGAIEATEAIKALTNELAEKLHAHGVLYLISQNSLDFALKLYDALPKRKPAIKGVAITEEDLKKHRQEINDFAELQKIIQNGSITETITILIAAAIETRASDIHIEAEQKNIKVRFRIDGLLHEIASLSMEIWPKIISRIKLLAGLKLNIADTPQDGRFTIFLTDDKIDVRVSALPTNYGESVVMRLLMSSAAGLKFEDLGLRGQSFKVLEQEIKRPNGLIVTTGPTGSGKTTTLYAILNKLNDSETKIVTIEDPIEYELKGINQTQVNPLAEYTFAKGLRSIVRQDPDIILVGEIRDLETAEISIQAALTGHLVLSTIHANSAAGTVPRFLSLGAKPFLLAPAMNIMMAQRLVRKICERCREAIELKPEEMEKVKKILANLPDQSGEKEKINPPASPSQDGLADGGNLKFYQGKGCPACKGLGYQGRIGIYEIMPMSKEIEQAILAGQISEYVMRDLAIKAGMVTMMQDGLLKALDGITTAEEVFRVAETKED